jgi:hypothetical protein
MTSYEILVDDNYHYMDEESRYKDGTFDSYGEALARAKAIVDDFLKQNHIPGMTSKELFRIYTGFGEDPFIVPSGESHFSAWDYARERCQELCREEDAASLILRHREWPPELTGFHAVLMTGLERKDIGIGERKALDAFRRAIDDYPDAMPGENRWYWLRLERGSAAFTIYLHTDRFELHSDAVPPEDVKWVVRFYGTGRLDCRIGNASAALEGMRRAALAPDFTLKASGG